MNKPIICLLLLIACLSAVGISATSQSPLLGKWQTEYELEGDRFSIVYQFKDVEGKLKCYSLYTKTSKGQLEKHQALVMDAIDFENGTGTARYSLTYEGETYEVDATLKLEDNRILTVEYSYYGYGDTETWKRIP